MAKQRPTRRQLEVLLLMAEGKRSDEIAEELCISVHTVRTHIQGILRTLGASSRSIMKIFLVQGATIGILGVVLGVISGVLLAINVETIVSGLEELLGFEAIDSNLYYISKLPSDVQLKDVTIIAIFAFLITVAFALIPASDRKSGSAGMPRP